ncbi:unnamed protein product [Ilex paraguariensis]|uniref:Glycine-rich protein n=1 Tax=Ilex paraguariensis TaxID=185542 RepID=A0ABC8RH31_9AQUA
MQGNRGGRNPFFGFNDPFAGFGGFGGFGGQRNLLSGVFGGRDPFDDPFFTRPFGGMFESGFFGPTGSPFMDAHASGFLEHQPSQPNRSRGPIIEELNSDDEQEGGGVKGKKDNPSKRGRLSKEPYVEDPDDEAEERKSKQMQYRNVFNSLNNAHTQPQSHSFTFQSSTVTYGGANGAYYTSSTTRRTGSDGLTMEESKEADSATAQATHRVSRGIHDKGHSLTRKLNSDGRVDTMQTLHNLNEDELAGFEKSWKGKARKHLPGWSEGFNPHDGYGSSAQKGGWALPSTENLHPHYTGSMKPDMVGSSHSQPLGSVKAAVGDKGGWALPSTESPHPHYTGSMKPDMAGSSHSQPLERVKAAVGDRTSSSRGRPRAATSNVDQARRH